ncbi:unnamed protein product [Protopolystoma xenopodis]|uniref:Uncharacterized protein n=1 Tax=Protopolystoma xenopodis TaxID=117903 RepID=A0A448WID8_9PLAT|nr:unnamed protein product [Protopolystoma xenopodis]
MKRLGMYQVYDPTLEIIMHTMDSPRDQSSSSKVITAVNASDLSEDISQIKSCSQESPPHDGDSQARKENGTEKPEVEDEDGSDFDDEDDDDGEDIPTALPLIPASLWTQNNIVEFKKEILTTQRECCISISSLACATLAKS